MELLELIKEYKTKDKDTALQKIVQAICNSKCKYTYIIHKNYQFELNGFLDSELENVLEKYNKTNRYTLKEYTELDNWYDIIKASINKLYAYNFDTNVYQARGYYAAMYRPKQIYFSLGKKQADFYNRLSFVKDDNNNFDDIDSGELYFKDEDEDKNNFFHVADDNTYRLAMKIDNTIEEGLEKAKILYAKPSVTQKEYLVFVKNKLSLILDNIQIYENEKAVVSYIINCLSGYTNIYGKQLRGLYRTKDKETGKYIYGNKNKAIEKYSVLDILFMEFATEEMLDEDVFGNSIFKKLMTDIAKDKSKYLTKTQIKLCNQIEEVYRRDTDIIKFTQLSFNVLVPVFNKQRLAENLNKNRSTLSRNISDMWTRIYKKYNANIAA